MQRIFQIFVVFLFSFIFLKGGAFAAFITVANDNALSPGEIASQPDCNGSASTPDSTTISGALALANKNDTILICPGVYKEKLVITKSGIALNGLADPNGSAVVLLEGENSQDVGIVIASGVQQLTLAGLLLQHYTEAAIKAVDGPTARVTIQDSQLLNNTNGVITGSDDGTFIHTFFRVLKSSLTLSSPTGVGISFTNCKNCRIQRNTIAGGAIGIRVRAHNSHDSLLNNNRLLLNSVNDAGEVSILLEALGNATLRNSTVQHNVVNNTASGVDIRLLARGGAIINGARLVGNIISAEPPLPGIELLEEEGGNIEKVKIQ